VNFAQYAQAVAPQVAAPPVQPQGPSDADMMSALLAMQAKKMPSPQDQERYEAGRQAARAELQKILSP